jgi:LEA14-like dessication related protein
MHRGLQSFFDVWSTTQERRFRETSAHIKPACSTSLAKPVSPAKADNEPTAVQAVAHRERCAQPSECRTMFRLMRSCLTLVLLASVVGCSLLPSRDPVAISVVGIEPLPAQELELRFAIKLRLQNPNETAIEYDGVAVNLDVNGRPLASGVSNQHGRIERYSEEVLVVPVSVSALTALRQAVGLNPAQSLNGLPYRLHGKLAGGLFGTVRFSDSGTLSLPAAAGY